MTVEKLIEQLKNLDPNKQVYVRVYDSTYDFAPAVSVEEENIEFKEDPSSEEILATEESVVISPEAY